MKENKGRPEFIDVDNPVQGKEFTRIYRKDVVGTNGNYYPGVVHAHLSGHAGARPYAGQQQYGDASGNPVQARNRKSPNPLEERQ